MYLLSYSQPAVCDDIDKSEYSETYQCNMDTQSGTPVVSQRDCFYKIKSQFSAGGED
jgi:hypothetical protein